MAAAGVEVACMGKKAAHDSASATSFAIFKVIVNFINFCKFCMSVCGSKGGGGLDRARGWA